MEYIFGRNRKGENLKTKGESHTNLTGYHSITREYSDQTITDSFRIVEKYDSKEDSEGNCYDWYVIDNHFRDTDHYTPDKENLLGKIDYLAMMTGIDLDEGEEEELVLWEDE